ncbi:hypothetical protein HNP84_000314 [Thermocatellispora tengchongensis]|uniref:Uncharacterized protein n=1 Tax=Thermocatellispora tengchongensis TaxID=1073253 RepID=A0A840NWQ8_9ACTN|nr:hypothetical protein [Thermocatellispora tengchongensis]MBB5130626.1 hypothetical protein [Thermocatellispora tengchongensis]
MNAVTPEWEQRSTVRVVPPVQPRKLAKVPFVELAEGRLQGVVSSGSDIERVYVSSITAGTHTYNCSTNNNRPCGALHSSPCKHLRMLADEAVVQYGAGRVARYLRVEGGEGATTGAELMAHIGGGVERTPAAVVFSRFLRHLAYLELPDTTEPLPELHWFPAMGVTR